MGENLGANQQKENNIVSLDVRKLNVRRFKACTKGLQVDRKHHNLSATKSYQYGLAYLPCFSPIVSVV